MAIKTVTVLDRQSIFDVAVQVYGEGVRGAFKLMQDNPEINLTTHLFAGQLLKVMQAPSNKVVAQYFTDTGLHPVGMLESMPSDGIGSDEIDFTNTIL